MDYQTQIDNLIELAIVQRDELKQLVEQLPQLREYLSAEVEKKFEAVEPELRSELEAFFAQKTDERVEDLRGEVSERIAEVLKSLEMAASAKYAALMQEKDRAAEVLNQAEAKIAEVQAAIPGKVKELVTDELSRFPRANQIDQLRKEFAEPRGLNPRGKWQAGERYQKLDLVSYNGESYVSNVDDNTEKPSRSSAAWTLSAARGQGGGGGGITSLNDLIGSPTSDLDIVGAEGSNYVRKTLTAGANVTLTETPTEITISSTGGGGGTSAETLIANVTNAESVAITKGQVVYAFAATGNRVSVKLAYNTSDATSAKTFGVVSSASISAGGTGTVTCVGVIDGLNLGTFVDGDSVYLGATPGTFTATKPYAPNHLVYVGIVERANAGNGELYVRIQNGYELDEIHDVQINAPKLAGQTLLYDATTDLWKNARLTGTANQIAVTNADAAVTLSIPTNPTLPGNVTSTGWIKTADGTAAAPAYAFTSEAGLGFYRVASTGVGFGTQSVLSLAFYPGGEIYGAQGSNRISLTAGGAILLSASSSNQPITLTPSGAATAGGLSLSRLTSTNQTLALLNYGTDELMSIAGTGYTGVGSRSNTGFLLYSNNTERARFLAGGNFLIAKTIDNALGRLQVNGAITMEETAGTGLFGFFGGSTLVYGSLAANPVVIRTNNTAALTFDTSQNATFAKDILLGTSGPSVPITLSGRAARQGLVFNGTVATSTSNAVVFGTGDFTVAAWVNPANLSGTQCVFGGANNAFVLRMDSGVFGVGKQSINGPFSVTSAVTAGKMVFVVYRRSGTTGTGYLNGIAGTAISDTNDYSVASTFIGSSVDTGTAVWSGTISGALIFNRALSATEIVELYERGVPAASDINSASNTSLLTGANSDFSSAGNWIPNPPANISGGKLNLLGTHAVNTGVTLVAGKRYRLVCTIDSITAGNFAVYNGSAYLNITGTAGAVSYEFNQVLSDNLYVRCTGGDAVVDNMFLYRVGAVLAPDAAQTGGGLTWYDTSGNGANITLPASGVSWNVPFNGRMQFADGNNSAPSMTFANDPDTGFYKVAAAPDIVYFGSNGQPSLRFVGGATLYSGLSNAYLQFPVSGAINLVADGATNQNVNVSASGTGAVVLNATNILFRSQTGASEWARFNNVGTLLLGTGTDSSNGRIQLATHTAITGGIGFGTDIAMYRRAASSVRLEGTTSGTQFQVHDGARGFEFITSGGNDIVLASTGNVANGLYISAHNGPLVLRSNSVAALTLDTSQNGILAGSYFFLGGAGSNFYIRSTGSNNGLIRGNFLSADFASGFLLRNDTGTVEYLRVENPSGAVLLGTATNSNNGRLQLATHTASTGGIGFGTDVTLYRSAADTLKTDDGFIIQRDINQQFYGLNIANANTGTSTLVTASVSNGAYGAGLTMGGQNFTNNNFYRANRLTLSGPFDLNYASGQHRFWIGGGGASDSPTGAQLVWYIQPGAKITHTPISYSLASWLTNGSINEWQGSTCTDSSTAASGTAASAVFHSFATPSLAATNAGVTTTDAATLYVASGPVAGTNQTITNSWGLWNAGRTKLGGSVRIDDATVSNSTSSGALVVSGGVGIAGNTYIGGNLVVTGTISPSSGAGLTNVWIPASQWIPRTTNGCGVDSTETTTNRQNFDELLFDPAAIEYAQALVRMPSNYNNGTVTARFFWSSSSSTGSVVWGLQARAFADDDALDTAFGTAQTVTDTLLATGDMHISAATSAITSGGTPAATTPLQFQIYRDATNGSDTLGSDARLLGVEISFTSV